MSRISKSMKGRGFIETFILIYVLRMKNQFIFGHWERIYFIKQSVLKKRSKNLPCFPSTWESLQSAILFILSILQWFLPKQILSNLLFVDTLCCKTKLELSFCLFMWRCIKMASDDIVGVLHQNWNVVFMCFVFVEQINVIFMRPLYEAVILCDCIINEYIRAQIIKIEREKTRKKTVIYLLQRHHQHHWYLLCHWTLLVSQGTLLLYHLKTVTITTWKAIRFLR